MRRPGLTVALLLTAAVTVGFNTTADGKRPIYVVNRSTLVSDAQIIAALPAFQKQIDLDLGPAWDVSGKLVFSAPPAGAWRIIVTDTPNCLFCGGYHEYRRGLVRAEVGATTGRDWQLTFSHELAEMLVDPYIRASGDGGRLAVDGDRAWLVEDADPVEDTKYAYERDSVLLSDFTLPAWYVRGSKGPWDFTRSCSKAGQMLDGGYQWFVRAGEWVQL